MSERAISGKARILIVDDTAANLGILRDALEPEGYEILVATSGESALKVAGARKPDLILLDVVMPGMDGYETCRRLKNEQQTCDIPVIFITARDDKESLLQGFAAGGVDYVTKPFAAEEVLARVGTHLEISRLNQTLVSKNADLEQQSAELKAANEQLQAEVGRRERAEEEREKASGHLHLISQQEGVRWGIEGFVGKSQTVQKILEETRQLQHAPAISVLILGESGTGKELIARAMHSGSSRGKEPFIPVNCASIPRDLLESAFFGHRRGAFTGADADRKGYFEIADGGTLFLDEVGEMLPELQAKLLRVLEDGVVQPVGGNAERKVDVRVMAATNADLQQKIALGAFRQDLYFRLARSTVVVPPLRERREDIPLLIEHFIARFAEEMGFAPPGMSEAAREQIDAYSFPGNIRELKNIIESALIKSGGGGIEPAHLHFLAGDGVQNPAEAGVSSQANWVPSKPPDEEDLITAYVGKNGSISNAECRQLLSVDKNRAAYLLDKMCQVGCLQREGQSRSTRYCRSPGCESEHHHSS
jgi:DNA-binding NtrC family response regulator